jgi:hypothetical protein
MVNAEIASRLKAVKRDAREALEDEAPATLFIGELSRPARRALNYCSGYKRRRLSYAEWERRSDEKSQNTTQNKLKHAVCV